MSIIGRIPYLLTRSFAHVNVDKELRNANLIFAKKPEAEIVQSMFIDLRDKRIGCFTFIVRCFGLLFYKLVAFIYVNVYYYFIPFVPIVVVAIWGDLPAPL